MKLIKPLIAIIVFGIGIFLVFWAYNHSPEAGLGERIADVLEGEKALSKTSYYSMMVAGSVMILTGVVRLVKSL